MTGSLSSSDQFNPKQSVNYDSTDYSGNESTEEITNPSISKPLFEENEEESFTKKFRRLSKNCSPSKYGAVNIKWKYSRRKFIPFQFKKNSKFLDSKYSLTSLKSILKTFSKDVRVYDIEKRFWRRFWSSILNIMTLLIFSSFILVIIAIMTCIVLGHEDGDLNCEDDADGFCDVLWGIARGFLYPFWYLMDVIPFELSEVKIRQRGKVLEEMVQGWNNHHQNLGLIMKSHFHGAFISIEFMDEADSKKVPMEEHSSSETSIQLTSINAISEDESDYDQL